MPTLSIGEGELYYEDHGSGLPLLLVTGLNGVASHWRPQVEALSRHFRVITYDQRGCGRSSAPPAANSIKHMASDARALLAGLGIASTHFAGHSTGGAIGQLIAAEHPQSIRKLALLSSWSESDVYFRKLMTMRKLLLTKVGVDAYVRAGSAFLYSQAWMAANEVALAAGEAAAIEHFPGVETVARRIDAVLAFSGSAFLPAICSPTLVMTADDDILTPPSFANELAAGVAGAELAVVAGGAHMFTVTNADAVNGRLLEFLRS